MRQELNRSGIDKEHLIETPELTAIRRSLTIAYENRAFVEMETPWFVHARSVILQVLRELWSERRVTTGTVARADWLLALVPNPFEWVRDPADERAWAAATQVATGQLAMMLTSPFSQMETEGRYGAWVEERLLRHYRAAHPEVYRAAVEFVAKFLQDIIVQKDKQPIEVRRAVVKRLVHALDLETRKDLLDIDGVAAAIEIPLRNVLNLKGVQEVDLKSFFKCVNAALAGKLSSRLTLADGTHKKVKIAVDQVGAVIIELDGLKLRFLEAGVLDAAPRKRAASLTKMLKSRPLLPEEEKDWQKTLRFGAPRDDDFVRLAEALRETPETYAASLAKPQNLNGDNMVPSEPRYYERLVGPIPKGVTLSDYVKGELGLFQQFMIKKGDVGLRRLAFGCLSASVSPLSAMANIPLVDVEKLLDALDPFSLLFGFEVCVERYRGGDRRALTVGRKFLERLFKDEKWLEQRCEVFSACAIISSTRLRGLANRSTAPLYWHRLASFAHAGVLTNALSNITDTAGFLKWAIEGFSGTYTWHAVADVREEPRWDSEWISPDSIKAELVGRCLNAIGRLGKRQGPASWQAIFNLAWDQIEPKLTTIFPGPLDGFIPTAWTVRREEDIKLVDGLLKQRGSFKEAPGLAMIVYSGGVDASHIDQLMRMLEGSNEELSVLKSAYQVLKCCAYVAATTRSAPLADAVVTRSLRLVTTDTQPGQVLPLMLYAMRACAAHNDLSAYYREIGKVGARFAYAAPKHAALDLRMVMEALCERDPRMMAALGRAMQILNGSSLGPTE